ncbi:MAG: hypothetical protein LC799_27010, partial [Actinobacteria bacterium]|nr:hypothetical protein [Actinomycetota bacterium]
MNAHRNREPATTPRPHPPGNGARHRAGSRRVRRWVPLVSLLAVVAAACGGGEGGAAGEGAAEVIRVDQRAPTPKEDVPSALDDPDDERLPRPLVDTGEII